MLNETSKTRSLKVAFLLDPANLTSLQTLLSEIQGSLEYKVKFSDGSTTKYSDVAEILAQPNSAKRFISAITASVDGEPGCSLFLTMRGDPEPSVEYTVTGVQRDVGYFADKLDDWVASCTQWYSPFYASNLGVLLTIGIVALPVYLTSCVAKVFPAKGSGWHSYLPVVTLAAVSIAEYWALKLFPRATFAIGYGAKRDQLFRVLQVSVLLAVIVALLSEWLGRYL